MKRIAMFGVRSGKRVVHWPGLLVSVLLASLFVLAVPWIARWTIGDAWNTRLGMRATVLLAALVTLGVLRRQRRLPLEQLPSLDSQH